MSIFNPRVKRGIMLVHPLADGVIGGYSGHGLYYPFPLSFSDWSSLYVGEDLNNDNVVDIYDYYFWWDANNFSQAAWEELNPDMPWPWN